MIGIGLTDLPKSRGGISPPFLTVLRTYQHLDRAKLCTITEIAVLFVSLLHRGWCPKFATGLIIMHSSKSIWVTNLLFCQNDSPIRRSVWQYFLNYAYYDIYPRRKFWASPSTTYVVCTFFWQNSESAQIAVGIDIGCQ